MAKSFSLPVSLKTALTLTTLVLHKHIVSFLNQDNHGIKNPPLNIQQWDLCADMEEQLKIQNLNK